MITVQLVLAANDYARKNGLEVIKATDKPDTIKAKLQAIAQSCRSTNDWVNGLLDFLDDPVP